jgi:hypothetical protein
MRCTVLLWSGTDRDGFVCSVVNNNSAWTIYLLETWNWQKRANHIIITLCVVWGCTVVFFSEFVQQHTAQYITEYTVYFKNLNKNSRPFLGVLLGRRRALIGLLLTMWANAVPAYYTAQSNDRIYCCSSCGPCFGPDPEYHSPQSYIHSFIFIYYTWTAKFCF